MTHRDATGSGGRGRPRSLAVAAAFATLVAPWRPAAQEADPLPPVALPIEAAPPEGPAAPPRPEARRASWSLELGAQGGFRSLQPGAMVLRGGLRLGRRLELTASYATAGAQAFPTPPLPLGDADVDSTSRQRVRSFGLGANAIFPLGRFEAWAGAGLRVIGASAEVQYREHWDPSLACALTVLWCFAEMPPEETYAKSDSAAVPAVAAGLRYGSERGLRLGVEVRGVGRSTLELDGFHRSIPVGGWGWAATIGWAGGIGRAAAR